MSAENIVTQEIPVSDVAVSAEVGVEVERTSTTENEQQVVDIDSGELTSCELRAGGPIQEEQAQDGQDPGEDGYKSSEGDDGSDDALTEQNDENSEAAAWPEEDIPALLEALLFASVEPLSTVRLSQIIGLHETLVQSAIAILEEEIRSARRGIELVRVAGKYQLRTRARFGAAVAHLKDVKPKRLSHAALETLSIIAYKQPVVKSEIDKIRGVDSLPTIKTLLDRQLVKIVGYQSTVGQPALYGTTEEFLAIFGLNGLPELPAMRDVRELEKDPGEVASD